MREGDIGMPKGEIGMPKGEIGMIFFSTSFLLNY